MWERCRDARCIGDAAAEFRDAVLSHRECAKRSLGANERWETGANKR